jgi:hypothetical protein
MREPASALLAIVNYARRLHDDRSGLHQALWPGFFHFIFALHIIAALNENISSAQCGFGFCTTFL